MIQMTITHRHRPIEIKIDFEKLLDEAATAVKDGVTAGIRKVEKPDGSPQKQNSPMWRERKRVLKISPNKPLHKAMLLRDKNTYKITGSMKMRAVSIRPVQAFIASKKKFSDKKTGRMDTPRDEVAGYLHDMGYDFFDVTYLAAEKIDLLTQRAVLKVLNENRQSVEKIMTYKS